MDEEDLVVEYTAPFQKWSGSENLLLAQGKGSEFLAIYRLEKPMKLRVDGKAALYEVVSRSLSRRCEHEDDEAWACVEGSEVSYWQRKELGDGLIKSIDKGTANLFEHFRMY